MNTVIQNILVFSALTLALLFLVRKYIWSPKKTSAEGCGGDDDCGCH